MLNAITQKYKIMWQVIILCTIISLISLPLAASEEITGSNQENITVKGVVIDDKGELIIGATVTLKGTTQATFTDVDGRFSINVPANGTLIFSFVSMNTVEIPINGKKEINVTMTSTNVDLSEVVVIGYGTQSRATVTTSISKVEAKDMGIVPSGNPMTLLQGKVPGLEIRVPSGQPGSDPQIILRGGSTTSPEADAPLVIIDGAIRTIRDVNYQDIETIQVLKDAASTAIYGSKASNGIIIITTKQGKSGTGRISFSYGLTIDHQPKRYPLSDAREYLTATRKAALHARNKNNYLTGSFAMSTSNDRNALNTTAFLDDYIS